MKLRKSDWEENFRKDEKLEEEKRKEEKFKTKCLMGCLLLYKVAKNKCAGVVGGLLRVLPCCFVWDLILLFFCTKECAASH